MGLEAAGASSRYKRVDGAILFFPGNAVASAGPPPCLDPFGRELPPSAGGATIL